MGQYRIPIRQEVIETIPYFMCAIGAPIKRIQKDGPSTHYFFENPYPWRKSELEFWITHEKEGADYYFMCGLSGTYRRLVKSLTSAGLFQKTNSDEGEPDPT